MSLLDWIRGPVEAQRSKQSKDDLARVLAVMEQITDATNEIDPEEMRRRHEL